ncbi:hypothetical protein DFP72DRAFT_850112 [Ephemerocybe angulata]|uniref:Uncharacterized protein n=1 Tax=Ephemerocybe angulata TaxID=980116 RepID=A0A8H6HT58_9AGAR|nr:hypothetical protein DFP72DRAFT_850112 [Tulosesus angulatus]
MKTDDSALPNSLILLTTCIEYARSLMKERAGTGSPVVSKTGITLELRGELEKMVDRVNTAWDAQVHLNYKLEDIIAELQRSTSYTKSQQLLRKFGGPFQPKPDGSGMLQLQYEPMVFIDSASKVVSWYLPGIFTSHRCDIVNGAVQALSDHPKSILRIKKAGTNWRDDRTTYADSGICKLRPGHVNMSVAWYEQGHTVSHITIQLAQHHSCFWLA